MSQSKAIACSRLTDLPEHICSIEDTPRNIPLQIRQKGEIFLVSINIPVYPTAWIISQIIPEALAGVQSTAKVPVVPSNVHWIVSTPAPRRHLEIDVVRPPFRREFELVGYREVDALKEVEHFETSHLCRYVAKFLLRKNGDIGNARLKSKQCSGVLC